MKGTVGEGELYSLPEDTLLHARIGLVSLRETEYQLKATHAAVKSGKKQVGDKAWFRAWTWPFLITEDGFEGLEVEGTTEPQISNAEGDKAKNWYETILDTKITLGDDIETDLLNGLPCIITVRHREPRSYNGRTFYECEVDDVFPAGAKEELQNEAAPF